jgi:hypothetical protein
MLKAQTSTLELLLTLDFLADIVPNFGHAVFSNSDNVVLARGGHNIIDGALMEILDLLAISGLFIKLDNVAFLVLDEPFALGTFFHIHNVSRGLFLTFWS